MKEIILQNGTQYVIADDSSVTDIILISDNRSKVFQIYDSLTDDNLSEFSIVHNGKPMVYTNYTCTGIRMNRSQVMTVHITLAKIKSSEISNLESLIDHWRNKYSDKEQEFFEMADEAAEYHNQAAHLADVIDDKLVVVDGDITDIQTALVEVYELIAGGMM